MSILIGKHRIWVETNGCHFVAVVILWRLPTENIWRFAENKRRFTICTELHLRWKGYNALQKPTCDVGMYFGNFRDYSVKIGNYKKLRMPSEKLRVHSVSGSHIAFRKTPGAFRQRSSWWRPLTECTRSFPEGIWNYFKFPIFTGISRRLPKCIIPLLR